MIGTVFQIPEWTGNDWYCVSDSGVDRPWLVLCFRFRSGLAMIGTVFQILEWTDHDWYCVSDSWMDRQWLVLCFRFWSGQAMIGTVFQIPEWTGNDWYCVSDSGVDRPWLVLCFRFLNGQAMISTVFQIPEWTGHDWYCVSDSWVYRPWLVLCFRFRSGQAMILNDFHTVCAWEKFPNKEAWKYDLMLSKKFTNMLTGEYLALMFKPGICRKVHVSPALKNFFPQLDVCIIFCTSAIFCPVNKQFHEQRQNFCQPVVPISVYKAPLQMFLIDWLINNRNLLYSFVHIRFFSTCGLNLLIIMWR